MDTNTLPIMIDWDIVPGEDESTLMEDMCELGDLNGGLPVWVIMEALNRMNQRGLGTGSILDAVQAEITAVAAELVRRGTSNA